MLDIPGDHLEGGGQILRTALALSCILSRPIRIFKIRAKRPNPGLKSQHLSVLETLSRLFAARTEGVKLNSTEIIFSPQSKFIKETYLRIDLQTAGSIGLFLQPLLLVAALRSGGGGLSLEIRGGTCGLGAIPVDYYPVVVFPTLKNSGLKANLEILRRGYYPKGGGEVKVEIEKITHPTDIVLERQGKITQIKGISIASKPLKERNVCQRQIDSAKRILLQRYPVPMQIEEMYVDTLSLGLELNLYAYTDTGCILWSDSRGEQKKTAEEVGLQAATKLINQIDSGAAVDLHLADNLIPWLALLGGKIKTSEVTLHTQTNIWICELFLGKIFTVRDNTISCEGSKGIL
ncbi:MAG: RNA 3'-terminal phosphate cyclase [Candidatus Omnitrophica bacterium]|nr:RNA 3'-terminal phosphate cyclase [Candidatus Omnitrophota bacterium]